MLRGVSRNCLVITLFCTLVFLIGVMVYTNNDAYIDMYKEKLSFVAAGGTGVAAPGEVSHDDARTLMAQLIQQRNNISRAMNLKQQKIGQLECKATEKNDTFKVSSTGGWCSKTSQENSGQHKTDKKLVPVLASFFKGKNVASFGDGPGRYKQMLSDTGLLLRYDAYDGAPFCEETSEGRVKYLDLTLQQYGLPLYDWVLSLEVAEHIPKDYEGVYLDNIVRHAKEGVVLSWAVPGQEGYSHINNRPFEYVKNVFENLGFTHDPESSQLLQKASSLEWLQTNTNVYRRKDVSQIDKIKTFLT